MPTQVRILKLNQLQSAIEYLKARPLSLYLYI